MNTINKINVDSLLKQACDKLGSDYVITELSEHYRSEEHTSELQSH